MNKVIGVRVACSLLLLFSAFGQSKAPQRTPPDVTQRLREERASEKKPAGEYVPDVATAVSIAEAVLIPIYGSKQIGYEKPFKPTLDRDVWTVTGSLGCKTTATATCVGGTAVVQLSKTTGAVLLLVHEE